MKVPNQHYYNMEKSFSIIDYKGYQGYNYLQGKLYTVQLLFRPYTKKPK